MERTEKLLTDVLQRLAIVECKISNIENGKAAQPKNATAAAPPSQKSVPKKFGVDFLNAQGMVLSHTEAHCNMCGCDVPFAAESIMEHIDGVRHKSLCPSSNPATVGFTTVGSSCFCNFCNEALNDPLAMVRHLTQDSHLKACLQSVAEVVDAKKISTDEFTKRLLRINKIQVMQTHEHCTICDEKFSKGTNGILRHIIDPMHRQLFVPDSAAYLDAQKIVKEVNGETYKCILCNESGIGKTQAMNHCAELNHFDRILNVVQSTDSKTASQAPNTNGAPNKTRGKKINIENLEIFNRIISKPTENYCTVCGVDFPKGVYSVILHVNGFKHKKAFNLRDEIVVYFLSLQGVGRSANDKFTCKFCNVVAFNSLDALDHCKNIEHAHIIRDCHPTVQ